MAITLKNLDKTEHITGGTAMCSGCQALLAFRLALKILGKDTILVNPAGCLTLSALYPFTPYRVPWVHGAIENTAAIATGIKMGLEAAGKKSIVIGQAGDGATYDIGFQALSGAAQRNEDIIYFCYNNSGYGNTGFQASGATPFGSYTTTTPPGKEMPLGNILPRKNMARIVAAHDVPYVATACTGYEIDFLKKVEAARDIKGFRYIEVLVPCTTGWGYAEEDSKQIGKEMVNLGLWPLYEIRDGKLTVTMRPRFGDIREHMRKQKRFKHLTDEQLSQVEAMVKKQWETLESDFFHTKQY